MRKRTRAQIIAARRNGAKSQGPLSAEGKAKVARNALTHGLTAKVTALSTEDQTAFQCLLDSFIHHFSPQNDPEFLAVEEMATAKWKVRRAWALETARLNLQLDLDAPTVTDKYEGVTNDIRTALSWAAARPELETFHRYSAQNMRDHDRAYRHLLHLQDFRLLEESELYDQENNHQPQPPPQLAELQNKPEPAHVDLQ